MGITIKDLIIPELMKIGWEITPYIYRREPSLAFAQWTASTTEDCCSHCVGEVGEWELALYFSTSVDKRELIKMCIGAWNGVTPTWAKKHWDTIVVVTDNSGGLAEEMRRKRRTWLDSCGQGDDFRCKAPNYHHWPVVWCRID